MKLLTILIILLSITSGCSKSPLMEADSLIRFKKYESAFKLLYKLPESDSNPDIVLKKFDIATEFFVSSIMHRIFAFKDIAKNESIEDYRGQEGAFYWYLFPVDSVLQLLIALHPEDGRLYNALSNYYMDVASIYGNEWFLPYSELQRLAKKYYLQADKLNATDYKSLYNLGAICIEEKEIEQGIVYLRRSLKLNSKFPGSNYNLSYALLSKEQYKDALPFAQLAFAGYNDSRLKADAAYLIGIASEGVGKTTEAIQSYKLAHQLNSENHHFVARLLNLYLKTGAIEQSDSLALTFFSYGPHDPYMIKDMIDYYYEYELQNHVPRIANIIARQYAADAEALGGIFFSLSAHYYHNGQIPLAQSYLDSAQAHYQFCYDPDHDIFRAIEDARKQIAGQK